MATYFRTLPIEVQASEATAAKATVYIEVGTHEAQTVTVSKAGAAFGVTAGTTATQVDGTLYKLVIHASDIDTEGDVAFMCVGATDTQYILGIRVVNHDPFDALAEVLADTGTDGVVLGANALTTAAIATGALTADAFAANAIGSSALSAELAVVLGAVVADAVWEEALADHDGTTGSVAEALLKAMQRGCGKVVTDNGDGTIKVYDTDGATLLLTITKSTSGDEVTWTPS